MYNVNQILSVISNFKIIVIGLIILAGTIPCRRQLKKGAVPSVFACRKPRTASDIKRSERADKKRVSRDFPRSVPRIFSGQDLI